MKEKNKNKSNHTRAESILVIISSVKHKSIRKHIEEHSNDIAWQCFYDEYISYVRACVRVCMCSRCALCAYVCLNMHKRVQTHTHTLTHLNSLRKVMKWTQYLRSLVCVYNTKRSWNVIELLVLVPRLLLLLLMLFRYYFDVCRIVRYVWFVYRSNAQTQTHT